jgi:hypothetical protein
VHATWPGAAVPAIVDSDCSEHKKHVCLVDVIDRLW